MDLKLLDERLTARGEPGFRARQVWEGASRGAGGYAELTSLPAVLRRALDDEVPFSTLVVETERLARDGTVKTLFRTHDGHPVEAVLMRYRDGRRSVCLSSQSGCPLTCTFCATGSMRFGRNLTASEILDQALHFRRLEAIDHCVFMGMGEPLLNLDHVLDACGRLPDLGVTPRRTAISTVGWVPGIKRLAASGSQVRLALSLHAPDDELRSRLMPVNERYPIEAVLAACDGYYRRRRRRVFVEYVMLDGVNDGVEQAGKLATLLDGRVYKVNLIPYNPTGAYRGSTPQAIAAFRRVLHRAGLEATVRLTRGRDIEAACGQLQAAAGRRAAPEAEGRQAAKPPSAPPTSSPQASAQRTAKPAAKPPSAPPASSPQASAQRTAKPAAKSPSAPPASSPQASAQRTAKPAAKSPSAPQAPTPTS